MIRGSDFLVITGWMNNLINERFKEYLNSEGRYDDNVSNNIILPCKMMYSVIFNTCSIDNSTYNDIDYLSNWVNCSKQDVINNLDLLVKKGLLKKQSTGYMLEEVE